MYVVIVYEILTYSRNKKFINVLSTFLIGNNNNKKNCCLTTIAIPIAEFIQFGWIFHRNSLNKQPEKVLTWSLFFCFWMIRCSWPYIETLGHFFSTVLHNLNKQLHDRNGKKIKQKTMISRCTETFAFFFLPLMVTPIFPHIYFVFLFAFSFEMKKKWRKKIPIQNDREKKSIIYNAIHRYEMKWNENGKWTIKKIVKETDFQTYLLYIHTVNIRPVSIGELSCNGNTVLWLKFRLPS